MRPHRRQEHHRLAPPDRRAQFLFGRHHQFLQRGLVGPPRRQRRVAKRPAVVLAHVQVVRARLRSPVVGHRHRRRRRATAQQKVGNCVVGEAGQEQVLRRLPAPHNPEEMGLRGFPILGIPGVERDGKERLQVRHARHRIVRIQPQQEPDRRLPLLRGPRHPAPGAAHRVRRRRPPDRQVHRRGARSTQPLLQQLFDGRLGARRRGSPADAATNHLSGADVPRFRVGCADDLARGR